jgi:hypothetical protein
LRLLSLSRLRAATLLRLAKHIEHSDYNHDTVSEGKKQVGGAGSTR